MLYRRKEELCSTQHSEGFKHNQSERDVAGRYSVADDEQAPVERSQELRAAAHRTLDERRLCSSFAGSRRDERFNQVATSTRLKMI
jgi:hypothetical protein